jgi:hypothetical protein
MLIHAKSLNLRHILAVTCAGLISTLFTSCAQTSLSSLSAPSVSAQSNLVKDLDRLVGWFGGEWDNHEQVWQQKGDAETARLEKIDDLIAHTHHIFAPVKAPKLGEHVFYVQQSLDGDMTKVYRQRVYRFTADEKEGAVKLEIFTPVDEKAFLNAHLKPAMFADLDTSALKSIAGCEVFWRFQSASNDYVGTMKPDACSFVSQRSGKRIFVTDTLKLSESEIWINDQARDEAGNHVFGSKTNTPIKNRKVRYFTGWVYFNRAGKDAKPTDKTFSSRRDLVLHSEGQYVPILFEDGTPSPYLLQLAQLTYQNTKTPILKFALVDKETKKTIIYIWGNTEAVRIGMNLGWFQSGLTQKPDRTAFGF